MDDLFGIGNMEQYMDTAVELFMTYVPKLVLAILTLLIGLWIIRMVVKVTRKGLEKSKADVTLIPFLSSLLSVGLKARC